MHPGKAAVSSFHELISSVFRLFFYAEFQNWSSPLQEMSSTPWSHQASTSCYGGKTTTPLWAQSQSATRPAPPSLESRPRGGDWCGLFSDSHLSDGFHWTPLDFTPHPSNTRTQTYTPTFNQKQFAAETKFQVICINLGLWGKAAKASQWLDCVVLQPSASSQVALGAFLFIPTQVRNPITLCCLQQLKEFIILGLRSYRAFLNVKTNKKALKTIAWYVSMKSDKLPAAASSFG